MASYVQNPGFARFGSDQGLGYDLGSTGNTYVDPGVATSPGLTSGSEGSGSGADWTSIGASILNVVGASIPVVAAGFGIGAHPVGTVANPLVVTNAPAAGGDASMSLVLIGGLALVALLLLKK